MLLYATSHHLVIFFLHLLLLIPHPTTSTISITLPSGHSCNSCPHIDPPLPLFVVTSITSITSVTSNPSISYSHYTPSGFSSGDPIHVYIRDFIADISSTDCSTPNDPLIK